MNREPITIIVTSSDGIDFAVRTTAPSYDRIYASRHSAAELATSNDFQQVKSLDDLLAPEFVFEAPRISGPLERRAAFKVIKGGKQS